MQRILLGVAATIMVAVGAWLAYAGGSDNTQVTLGAGLLRGGLVLGAFALALPQVRRLLEIVPGWYLWCLAGGLALVVVRPTLVALIVPLLTVLWFLGPRRQLKAAARAKGGGKRAPARERQRQG